MTALLSDHLKAIRDTLKSRRSCGLFMLPCLLAKFIKRFNTLIALAEEQEAELRLAKARALEFDDLPQGATILRFPRRLVIISRSDDGGDAA
ncbi:hypothetical protein [Rhizobium metallidurans]|uniref:Uncharacterized protein n=1 Tax=Rhizobium metallidurans TaxID=1265931 RepID=A0A7W6GA86_9HYPH|nr:hypothetical protein [Rhizobium metallidurans]MBB3963519.1 hypothetical protein [Rhizobium metallidurans]